MKTIKNQQDRQLILQQLRKAVCLQTSLWDTCLNIREILPVEYDVVARVIKVTPQYSGQKLGESDVDAILAGLEKMNPSVPIGQWKKMRRIELDQRSRNMLLNAFQNAISMQGELWSTANSLKELLDCTMEVVTENILGYSIVADIGIELNEMDLHALLGEPDADGYTWSAGPLKPQVRH